MVRYSAMPLMFPECPLCFHDFFLIWRHKGHSGTEITLYVSRMPLMFPRVLEIFESPSGNIRGTALYYYRKTEETCKPGLVQELYCCNTPVIFVPNNGSTTTTNNSKMLQANNGSLNSEHNVR